MNLNFIKKIKEIINTLIYIDAQLGYRELVSLVRLTYMKANQTNCNDFNQSLCTVVWKWPKAGQNIKKSFAQEKNKYMLRIRFFLVFSKMLILLFEKQ